MNITGTIWRVTTYGSSHDAHIGVIIDGCPAGLLIDLDYLQQEMQRRRPGQSKYTTARSEEDRVTITSGLYDGITTGTPIHLMISNKDQRSKDYDHLLDVYRPSHADYTYHAKYGLRDHRGGGRSSARETACRVAAGAIAKLYLSQHDIDIIAHTEAIGPHQIMDDREEWTKVDIEASPLRCPHKVTSAQMEEYLSMLQSTGDTCGGVIHCRAHGVPVGLGSPIYQKLESRLGQAMLSINACVGFDYGLGFRAADMTGSAYNDAFYQSAEGQIRTSTNHSGGIQGGISNGMPLLFRCAFKPISSIKRSQNTVDTHGSPRELQIDGRHDPCVVPRAVPIVEAMTALVLADLHLMALSDRIEGLSPGG